MLRSITFIRFVHTAIFVFFNVIMAVVLYEVIVDKISTLTHMDRSRLVRNRRNRSDGKRGDVSAYDLRRKLGIISRSSHRHFLLAEVVRRSHFHDLWWLAGSCTPAARDEIVPALDFYR